MVGLSELAGFENLRDMGVCEDMEKEKGATGNRT
jgi:hypothetical protein